MGIYSLLLIALALSLDAFGVAISIGMCNCMVRRHKIKFCFSFGFFQFLFSFIGAYAGFLFNTYVAAVPQVIGGMVISAVGIFMIKEGFEKKSDTLLLDPKMYIVLGASVSIDALVVGFTVFNNISDHAVIISQTLFIGFVSGVISCIGFIISRYLRKINIITKYSDFVGGIILTLFGLKMMFF